MLDKDSLKNMILANFRGYGWQTQEFTEQLAEAVARAVVEHIKAGAEVTGSAGDFNISGGRVE
jgi:hypothetical protein